MTRPEPFGKVIDRRQRFVRPAPTVLHRQVRASDLALNQLRQRVIERSRLERLTTTASIWLCVAIIGYFAVQFLRVTL